VSSVKAVQRTHDRRVCSLCRQPGEQLLGVGECGEVCRLAWHLVSLALAYVSISMTPQVLQVRLGLLVPTVCQALDLFHSLQKVSYRNSCFGEKVTYLGLCNPTRCSLASSHLA